MRNTSTYALCALCAVPALVQTVSAEETANVQNFVALMGSALELSSEFIDVLDAVQSETSTPAAAATSITAINEKATLVKAEMEKVAASFTPEEQQYMGEQMSDPEFVAFMKEIEEAMAGVQAKLIELKYYDNAELQAACEEFFKITE